MPRDYDHIPQEFYEEAWEDSDYPMACVSLDNKFQRVNHAFERMLGYSSAELEERTWMTITDHQYIGGDLASVQAVLDGRQDSYRLEKDYIHKRGHRVPIVLIVRRYPRNSIDKLLFFRVEAPIATATRTEVEQIEANTRKMISDLHEEIDQIKQGVTINNQNETNSGNRVGGDFVRGDKNDANVIKYMIYAIISLGLVVTYMAYYVSTTATKTKPRPPQISSELNK